MVWLLCALSCADPNDGAFEDGTYGGAALFEVDGAFWDAPFPSDHRVDVDTRRVDLTDFPNPGGVELVNRLLGMLDGQAQGWSVSGMLAVPFDRGLAADNLPDRAGSVAPGSKVFLIDVDDDPEGQGTRYPIDVAIHEQATVFGPEHAVVALPLQGRPLAARRRMAMVVLSGVRDVDGRLLQPMPAIETLLAGDTPKGWRDDVAGQYAGALGVLAEQGIDLTTVAGLSVFTTGRPTRNWNHLVDQAQTDRLQLVRTPLLSETHPDYCVYESFVEAPIYQEGEAPYSTEGGGLVFDANGDLQEQDRERARMFITVPRVEPDEVKRPTVVFIRTGAGGDTPLMDRGVRDAEGYAEPGTGYAATFARAGWASVMIDGPLGGPLRNPGGLDEQFLIFNVANPEGLRGTLQQSALELALLPDLLKTMVIPSGTCDGLSTDPASRIEFNTDRMALFGHSMGATIAPLVATAEPRYAGIILSGAGGSWIHNVLYKKSPVDVLPLAATMLGESTEALDRFHPALTLLQWAGEPADPPMFAEELVLEPILGQARHVLMLQGVQDTYIPSPVANALSLSLGLDLAGPALDAGAGDEALSNVLRWSNGSTIPLPAGLNRGTADERNVTAVVTQHGEDGIEDGHEVVFQLPTPHHQVSCFLQGLVADSPVVAGPGFEGDPCPLNPADEPED